MLTNCEKKAVSFCDVAGDLWRRRRRVSASCFSRSTTLFILASLADKQILDHTKLRSRADAISTADFNFNFNAFDCNDCLLNFRFIKADILNLSKAVAWPDFKIWTQRSGYRVEKVPVTFIVLLRLVKAVRWVDSEFMFGKRWSVLSEIFLEALERMMSRNGNRLLLEVNEELWKRRAPVYARAIREKCQALPNSMAFTDGTGIRIARPKGYKRQTFWYIGHKRNHALKLQDVTPPDGLFLHSAGPIEGRRHDWTLYMPSGMDETLDNMTKADCVSFCLYGTAGYNHRSFLEVPFQGFRVLILTSFRKLLTKLCPEAGLPLNEF